MQNKSLSSVRNFKDIKRFAEKIKSTKYFKKISLSLLKKIISKGEYINLNKEEILIQKNQQNSPKLIILLEGSLIINSKGNFLMRLNQPGDVFGEMFIIFSNQNYFSELIAEKKSKAIVFRSNIFEVKTKDSKASLAYMMLSHILAEKLKHTYAQSILKNNIRSQILKFPNIIIVDHDNKSIKKIKELVKNAWGKTHTTKVNSFLGFTNNLLGKKIDFFIIDPEKIDTGISKKESIRRVVEMCSTQKTPILIVSKFCRKEENRKYLTSLGASDFLIKPYSDFDMNHKLIKFRNDHYRQKELEQVEIAADTDRLTGIANRRKMDEFLDALVTIFSDNKQPFSIIIADIDNFKHYNDTNGHKLGDKVLSTVAKILKNEIRRGDLAARFGGEEFVIILPNCSKKNAIKIGNKLRLAIAKEKLQGQEKQPLGNLTCTFGLATFPQDAETKDLLLELADKSLYLGKSRGRNKLVAYNKKNFM